MPVQPGGAPLAQVLGEHLSQVLIQELSQKLANALPCALVDTLAGDILDGADAIAAFTGKSARQIYHLAQQNALPVFRIGATLHARKSTLLAWIEAREQAAGK